MNRLADEITKRIKEKVQASLGAPGSSGSELRMVFHGPPAEILDLVLDRLCADGGCRISYPNGSCIVVPVVLVRQVLPAGSPNPPVGLSGLCDADYPMTLRNHSNCPRFVILLPPGQHVNLSGLSTSEEFGLGAQCYSGNATIDAWWADELVSSLVATSLSRLGDSQLDAARSLVERAVRVADGVDKHDVGRRGAWGVLGRLFALEGLQLTPWTGLSLACGFPPTEDGRPRHEDQERVLMSIAGRLEAEGLGTGIETLCEGADEADQVALRACLLHLQGSCEFATAFAQAPAHHYGPYKGYDLGPPPDWWLYLTVERWQNLLEEEQREDEALRIECTNSLIPRFAGLSGLTASAVALRVEAPAGEGPTEVTIRREAGGAGNRREWTHIVASDMEVEDLEVPRHKAPLRYFAAAPGYRAGSIKVISLETWEPGIFVFCRNAEKVTPPRKSRGRANEANWECSLLLGGLGRHYVEVYARPSISLRPAAAGVDASGDGTNLRQASVAFVSERTWGLEIDATGDCYYDLIATEGNEDPIVIRVHISCQDVEPEGCRSEFERLINLNRGYGRGSAEVHVDRQVRCADLQTWMLSESFVERSYRPIVLSSDYAGSWRKREWTSAADTIFSSGHFINDPRPHPDEMCPPDSFIAARKEIAKRIRGAEEMGLAESGRLGEWIAGDVEFCRVVEDYVASYMEWLSNDPEVAAWADLGAYCELESGGRTLSQTPEAILVSPLHPLRIAWHCLAQRALYLAYQKHRPCPAASVLEPGRVPDILPLPLRRATGTAEVHTYLAVDCNSDYWTILWNGASLSRLAGRLDDPPFDRTFGVRIGAVSSGFSGAQVERALDDVAEILCAKPILNVRVSSAPGQTNACNEGLLAWSRRRFRTEEGAQFGEGGGQLLQILDERDGAARPEDTEISNLTEDTLNSVRWFDRTPTGATADLGIVTQLETSNPSIGRSHTGSPLAVGGLVRHRVRMQLPAASGAFLTESRMGTSQPPTGDGLSDRLSAALVRLENLGSERLGYTFAPSVHAVSAALEKADFAAVSSSAVDPACFLGQWLDESYLWDYDLPSYSQRAGDNNGYYLLSKLKLIDKDAVAKVLSRLPGCTGLDASVRSDLILEVSRRGIPTVRGLSAGDSGAAGHLGLFVASRLLQDEFRVTATRPSLLPILEEHDGIREAHLIVPVDPFRGYLEDLRARLGPGSNQRPDLLVFGISVSDSSVEIRLTPIEVKYRQASGEPMTDAACREALGQATALSTLLKELCERGRDPELILWRIAFEHLLVSMISFGFRVYSQRPVALAQSRKWTDLHTRCVEAIYADSARLDIDHRGRLIVIGGTATSQSRDIDGDGFRETIILNSTDAAGIVTDPNSRMYDLIAQQVGRWEFAVDLTRLASPFRTEHEEPPAGRATPSGSRSVAATGTCESMTSPIEPDLARPRASEELRETPSEWLAQEQAPTLPAVVPQTPEPLEAPSGPESPAGLQIEVGDSCTGFAPERRLLCLGDTRLNQLNVGVVGDLGTGKTQFLKSFIYQLANGETANQGIRPRVLVLDYKRDYCDDAFVNAVGARVVQPVGLPLNLFDVSHAGTTANPWLERFKFFSDVLDKLYSGIGPVQRKHLKEAVRKAYEDCTSLGQQPTLYDVHANYEEALRGSSDSALSIIDDLVDMELFTRSRVDGQSFRAFFDGIVVLNLSAIGQDDRTKHLLVAVILNLLYEDMLRLPKRPYWGPGQKNRVVDSFLLVDEADNIMKYEFDVLRRVLLQGREFGAGVILASQYLSHFKVGPTDYKEPLLSWFIHKVPNLRASELSALGISGDLSPLAERVKTLANHECLFKTFDSGGEVIRGLPFFEIRGALRRE